MQSGMNNMPAASWNENNGSEGAVRGDVVFDRVHMESSQESRSPGSSPQTPSFEKSRTTSTSISTTPTTDRSNLYQRDEKCHSDLKKAASFRRRLERETETNVSTEKIQQAAIARGLECSSCGIS